jgi:hypothetical protein
MRSIKEELKQIGIELESRYLIYRKQETTFVVPYYHIRTLEFKGNRIVLYTGGVERIVIEVPEYYALPLFEELLLHIERVYL